VSPRVRAWIRRLIPALLLLALAGLAWARLGGGGGFSGGGGGGGGSDELAGLIIEILLRIAIELCFEYPEVGIPMLGITLLGTFLYMNYSSWRDAQPRPQELSPAPPGIPGRELRDLDPDFSRVVLLDLAHALFHRVHEARGHGEWAPLRPYLGSDLWRRVSGGQDLGPGLPRVDEVREVVVGSVTPTAARPRSPRQELVLRFRANYDEVRGSTEAALYVEQTWVLARPRGTPSPRPEAARVLGCPSCGATVELTPEGLCTFCDEPVVRGQHGWQVLSITSTVRTPQVPLELSPGHEAGTEASTRYDPDLARARRELKSRHPDLQLVDVLERLEWMFLELQAAWSAQDEERMRPLETDALHQAHRFWLDRYRARGWRNHIEDVTVTRKEVVRVEVDSYFEAVTVRIFATMKDYTLDRGNSVVGGDRGTPRQFSEYWTLVRTLEAARREEHPAGTCPSCGAPLDKVSAAGVCAYCDAKIVGGDFGWVLALIEQDEVYSG
jgi:hypothetical protein